MGSYKANGLWTKRHFSMKALCPSLGQSALQLSILMTALMKWGIFGSQDFCHWLQQSHSSAAQGLRLTGMRGEQWQWEDISGLGRLKQPEGGGQSISLPALNNLGWQKQRTVWVVQGVGLSSAKGSGAEGQQNLREQQRSIPGPDTASVLQERVLWVCVARFWHRGGL